jgi:hypothetical protein
VTCGLRFGRSTAVGLNQWELAERHNCVFYVFSMIILDLRLTKQARKITEENSTDRKSEEKRQWQIMGSITKSRSRRIMQSFRATRK